MERSIFPKPEVLRELQNYVEVRLHTDKFNQVSRDLQELKLKRLNDPTMPIYEIVDPETGKTLEIRKGADLLTGGREFREFLARHARKR